MFRLVRWVLQAADLLDYVSENRLLERGMLSQAFQFARVNGVKGDYFEFGVFQGRTFIYAHRMKHKYRLSDVKLWAFDSFEGLPRVKAEKDEIWNAGQFSCGLEDFRRILKRRGIAESEYETVKGYYCDSLNAELHTRMAGRKAMVVYVDCDLYESTIDVMRFLPPYLQNGTILCFDDYYNYKGSPDQGEQRAIREFLQVDRKITFIPYLDYGVTGKAFICRLLDEAQPVG